MSLNDKHVSYAFSKMSQAVDILATGANDVRWRLLGASVPFFAIDPAMIPLEIREHLLWVRNQLTRFEPYRSEVNWYSDCGHLEKIVIKNKLWEVSDDSKAKELYETI